MGRSGHHPADSWDWYVTGTGGEVVHKELKKAFAHDKPALARLERIMNLRATGRDGPTHSTHLRGDIHEIRVSGRGVIYRLLFARVKERQVLLSLRVFTKKSQKTPTQEIDLAEDRWVDWKRRHPSR